MADAQPYDAPLEIGVRPVRDGVALVTVAGEVDIATAPSLRAVLAPLAGYRTVQLLVCDLSRVSFFACSGVTLLLDTRAALVTRNARLRLVATARAVLRPLGALELQDVLPVSPDVHSALF